MIGDYQDLVTFQDPVRTPDGVGGYTETWSDLSPATWKVAIVPATAADQERTAPGTVITQASSRVLGYYHPSVSTATRMLWNGKTFAIASAVALRTNPPTMELAAVETVIP
jgi:head-tail adaptor